ncbi:41379_t:CDS:2, partial [Gigaspora margarita]
LKEGNFYTSHEAFVIAVKSYAKQQGFQVHLGKYEKNAAGQIHKRTIVCSREDTSADHQQFTSEERLIPLEVQQKIMLLQHARCNIPTIRAISKEEFDELDANNFVETLKQLKSQENDFQYEININPETNELDQFKMPFGIFTSINNYGQSICFARTLMLNENTNSFNWVFSMFLKLVNNYAPKVFFTDEDSAIIKSVKQIFQPFGTKHVLCLWHLFKNVIKNLNGVLESDWAMFIKSFYKCLNEYEESNFVEKWEQLKTHYPKAVKYLSKIDKNLKRWTPCYNRQIFMADITTQRGESMNNLMKGYIYAMTSLTTFLKAFESAIEQRKEAAEFIRYQENNKTIKLVTSSSYKKQANPNEQALIKTYRAFYNTSITISQQVNSINIEEDNDYEYFLKCTWQKVQDIEEIKAHVLGKKSISLTKNQIKNPPIIKSKGRTSNKRTLSRFETTKLLNLSKKHTLEPNLQCTNEILEVDDLEENIDFKSDNFPSSFKDCSIKENIQTQ